MAKKFDLSDGASEASVEPKVDTFENPVTPPVVEKPEIVTDVVPGLSYSEMKDPNSIKVEIADKKSPIVVLFGPPACGKTMTLIRLTRFLKAYGYTVSPIKSFRPSQDTHYAEMCAKFNQLVNSNTAADGNSMISFMLVEVLSAHGQRICQILEAPGEYYFNPKYPSNPFPAYVNDIISCNNRKIWLFMLEPNWMDPQDRMGYVDRIHTLKTMMRPADRAVFLYNKVDLTHFVISPGKVHLKGVIDDAASMYTGIFTKFANENPLTRWFKPYNCSLVPFSNGFFSKSERPDGSSILTYQQGVDEYPRMLWNSVMKLIRG